MSFDRPCTRATAPRGAPLGRWTIPRTSPSPPPAGNLTSSVSAATVSNSGADTQGWRAKLINTAGRVRAIRGAALANTTRVAAVAIHDRYGNSRQSLWFEGHWGFQYYLEARGAKAVERVLSLTQLDEHLELVTDPDSIDA